MGSYGEHAGNVFETHGKCKILIESHISTNYELHFDYTILEKNVAKLEQVS